MRNWILAHLCSIRMKRELQKAGLSFRKTLQAFEVKFICPNLDVLKLNNEVWAHHSKLPSWGEMGNSRVKLILSHHRGLRQSGWVVPWRFPRVYADSEELRFRHLTFWYLTLGEMNFTLISSSQACFQPLHSQLVLTWKMENRISEYLGLFCYFSF